jgi:hypothetical protein
MGAKFWHGFFKATGDIACGLIVQQDVSEENHIEVGEPAHIDMIAGEIVRGISGSALSVGDRVMAGTGASAGKAIVATVGKVSFGVVVARDVGGPDERVFIKIEYVRIHA